MTERVERCETCRFWQQQSDDTTIGWCERFPPVYLGNGESTDGCRAWGSAVTDRHDWCGEYQPRAGDGDTEPQSLVMLLGRF